MDYWDLPGVEKPQYSPALWVSANWARVGSPFLGNHQETVTAVFLGDSLGTCHRYKRKDEYNLCLSFN